MRKMICLALIGLTACNEPVRIERVKPPADLMTCMAEPEAPILLPVPWDTPQARAVQIERDRQTLDFILKLVEAGADCRAKVNGLREWAE